MSELELKLLELASDLDDAQASQNWFAVNGVKRAIIDMVENNNLNKVCNEWE
ncbi:hypothetical protein D3C74_50260 [compost metagenome]